eukprot:scaffold78326_cov21-Tisochrysis_lutea.AAC.1
MFFAQPPHFGLPRAVLRVYSSHELPSTSLPLQYHSASGILLQGFSYKPLGTRRFHGQNQMLN